MAVEYNQQDYKSMEKQILVFPDHYVAVAQTFLKDDSASVTIGTRKIIKAGTIYPANDSTALGIVFHDIDVTDGDRNGALLIHGFIKTAALPALPVSDAKSALKQMVFLPLAAVTTAISATKLAIANAEAKDVTHSVVIAITGATFRDVASTLTNWTIVGETTTKVVVTSIVVAADGKSVTVNTKNSAATAEGDLTIIPAAAATSTGDVPAAAITIATVAAAAGAGGGT